MNSIFKQIIQEICDEKSINYKFLSKDWVIMLEKDGKTRFISGYKFDLNSQGTGIIADDKYATYEVLKEKNIPVIEYKIVYNKTNNQDYASGCNSYEYVKDFFTHNNNSIVIKPNEGTCGKGVYHITNLNEIDDVLDKIFAENFSISMSPFYNIKHEYRTILIDGEPELLYSKYLPIVIGNGKKTIRELLIEFNPKYFANILNDSKYDRILDKDEKFKYSWKFNLSQGSIAKTVTDTDLSNRIINIAKKVCKEINLKFGSVDIIQTTDNKLYVLEVNSGVMMDNYINLMPNGYMTAKNIYKKAIDSML